METVPKEVKHCVKALYMHKNDLVTTITTMIPSIPNTLKKIYIGNIVLPNLHKNYIKTKNFIFRISSDIT